MAYTVPTLFILLFLIIIDDYLCRKDIRRYKVWRRAYRESSGKIPEPKDYHDTKPVKILNLTICCGLVFFFIIYILLPLAKFSLKVLYYCFELIDILTNAIF